MKKQLSKLMWVTGLVVCLLISSVSFAQDVKWTLEERATMMSDKLKSSVQLTDEQYAKVYDVNVRYATKMQELRKQSGAKEDQKQAFKNLRKEQHDEINAILTSEQQVKYKELQKQKGKDRKDHHEKK
jgi:Spy/CpxP family protein refolding chaperone